MRPRPAQDPSQAVVERASATDRAFLAMDGGEVPEQFGVVLVLGDSAGLDVAAVRRAIEQRLPAVPRLRQRLTRTPLGCGGPVWVDDPGFDVRAHVRTTPCPAPGDERALLDVAVTEVTRPLPRSAPLWSAVLVTGLAGDRVALVVILHHVLADGIGGLAVLGSLVDQGPSGTPVPFPRPRPGAAVLARDALRRRAAALRRGRRSWRLLVSAMSAGGGLHPPPATPCSLTGRTGPGRRVAVVRRELEPVRAAAHARGATTNDVVLVAVAGALGRVLRTRGETVDTLMVTVPVSGRPAGDGSDLGNLVSPLLVAVPVTGDVGARLEKVAAEVRAGKAAATGPPPIALLGWLFRPLARAGGFRWYMNHQHRFHTLVSHVRGPAEPLTFLGSPVLAATPVGLGDGGNTTVFFEVLTYAGTLTVTAVVDPECFPELDELVEGLREELAAVTGATAAHPG